MIYNLALKGMKATITQIAVCCIVIGHEGSELQLTLTVHCCHTTPPVRQHDCMPDDFMRALCYQFSGVVDGAKMLLDLCTMSCSSCLLGNLSMTKLLGLVFKNLVSIVAQWLDASLLSRIRDHAPVHHTVTNVWFSESALDIEIPEIYQALEGKTFFWTYGFPKLSFQSSFANLWHTNQLSVHWHTFGCPIHCQTNFFHVNNISLVKTEY